MVELRALGSVGLVDGDGRDLVEILARTKSMGLLAYLALACPGGYQRRDLLLPLLWPDSDEKHARASLRKTVHGLRQVVGPNVLVSAGDENLGVDLDELWFDASVFQEAGEDGRHEEALSLYGGDLLAGFHVPGAPEFTGWMEQERDRLRRVAARSAWTLAEKAEERDDPREAVRWGRRCLELAPYDEGCVRRLIRLMDRFGERPAALRLFEAFERKLRDDLELAPSSETTHLAMSLRLRQEPARFVEEGSGGAPGNGAGPSLAVLPFTVATGAREHGEFSEGLHQEVMAALAARDTFGLVSRTSVLLGGRRAASAQELARTLGADLLLEGCVRICGERVRLDVSLVDPDRDRLLWSWRGEDRLEGALEAQVRLGERVVQDLPDPATLVAGAGA